MKKEAFLNYSEWLFSILFELEKQLDISNYGIEGCRTLAHIAERLLGVYYTYQMSKGTYRLGELQHAIFWNPQKTLLLFPAFERNNISIVMACSDYYIPYAAVTLESIVQTSDLQNNYDIVLLNTYLSDKSKKIFEKVIENCSNFSIRYYDVGELISSHRFIANNHVSVETFYRLFVQKIFVNYEKILYLDSDLIVKCDIAQLYNIDIGSNLLAATRDADFISQYCGAVKKVKKYTDTILKLDDPYSYFQAGVIVFNIKEMNLSFKNESLVEFGSKQEYMYVDQDVLNSKCQGRVYYLDMAWNVFSTCGGARMTNIKTFAPLRIYEEYLCARKHPKIIHYAGYLKPWNDPMEDFALEFWATIKESFLYEIILSRMSADVAWHTAADYENYQKNFHQSSLFLRKAKMRIKKIVAVFFPVGTNRRDVMKRFYFRFRGWNISN